jgi:hypothetical protein
VTSRSLLQFNFLQTTNSNKPYIASNLDYKKSSFE